MSTSITLWLIALRQDLSLSLKLVLHLDQWPTSPSDLPLLPCHPSTGVTCTEAMSSFSRRCWRSVGDAGVLALTQHAGLPTEPSPQLLVTFPIIIKLGEGYASTQPQAHQILSPVLFPQHHNHKVKQILTPCPPQKKYVLLKDSRNRSCLTPTPAPYPLNQNQTLAFCSTSGRS